MTNSMTNPCIRSTMLDGTLTPGIRPIRLPMTPRAPKRMDAKMIPIGLALANMAMPSPADPTPLLKSWISMCCTPFTSVNPAIPARAPLIKKAVTNTLLELIPDILAAESLLPTARMRYPRGVLYRSIQMPIATRTASTKPAWSLVPFTMVGSHAALVMASV